METEDVLDEDLDGFSGGRQLGKWDKMCRFREAINNGKYDRMSLGFGETSDKVDGDVRPRTMRNRQPLSLLGTSLSPSADRAGRDEFRHVATNRGPPKPAVEESYSATNARVTSEGGRVSPLKDRWPDLVRAGVLGGLT